MAAQNNQVWRIPDLRQGLDSRSRVQDVALGFGSKVDCAWLYRSLEKAHGYERVSHRRPWEAPLYFDTEGQRLYSSNTSDGAVWSLPSTGAFEFGFRPATLGGKRWLIGKVVEEGLYQIGAQDFDTSLIDWAFWIDERSLVFRHTAGTHTASNVLSPGKTYHVTLQIFSPSATLIVYELDLSDPDSITVTEVANVSVSSISFGTAGTHCIIGSVSAVNDVDTAVDFGIPEGYEPAAQFQGAIQDIRVWSALLADPASTAASQLQGNESNLVAYYTLTDKVARKHAGAVSGNPPIYEAGQAVWDGTDLLFHGMGSYVRVSNPARFRKQSRDENKKLTDLDAWTVTLKVRVDELKTGSVFHWVPALQSGGSSGVDQDAIGKSPFDGAWATPTVTTGIVQLSVEKDPGDLTWKLRATWWAWDSAASQIIAYSKAGPAVTAGTEYRVMLGRQEVSPNVQLDFWVDGTYYGVTLPWNDGGSPLQLFQSPAAEDDPTGSGHQEVMVLGRSIGRALKAYSDPTDPDDVRVYWRSGRSFKGRIRHVAILAEAANATLDSKIQNFDWNVEAAWRFSTLMAAWPMDEGVGESLGDVSGGVESIPFEEDLEILRGQPCKKSLGYGMVHGIVDHRYRSASGEVRKVLVVHDGGLSELVDKTSGNLQPPGSTGGDIIYKPYAEGFRNDTDDPVSVARLKDTLVLCVPDSPPMHLWKDSLWRFSVKPLRVPPPHGLIKQGDQDDGVLTKGLRKYVFTLYNAHADKESSTTPPIFVEIFTEHANVAFGKDVEVHQRPATTGVGTEAEPWDFSGTSAKQWLKVASWNAQKKSAPDASGSGKKAKWYLVKFTNSSGAAKGWYEEIDGIIGDEVKAQFEKRVKRATLALQSEGRLEIRSDLVGTDARVKIDEPSGSGVIVMSTLGLTAGEYSGTGSKWLSGLVGSVDPQATHLRIYRSQLQSNDYHLVAEVPLAHPSYEDALPDGSNISELADLFAIPIPKGVSRVVAHGSRLWFYGEKLRPWLVWPSDPVKPEIVQTADLLSLTAGRTLEIVGAMQIQDTLVFGKQDSLIGVYESGSSQLPAIVRERSQDVGLVSPFGQASVEDVAFFASERGAFVFDGSAPRYVSAIIQPTWLGIDMENARRIHAAHYRKAEVVFWTVPTGKSKLNGKVINDQLIACFYGAGAAGGGLVGWTVWPGCYFRSLWTIPDDDEEERIWAVDELGFVYRMDVGNDFGVGSSSPSLNKTGTFAARQSNLSIVRIDAPNDSKLVDGWEGLPIVVVKQDYSDYAVRYIVSDKQNGDPTVITLDHDLPWNAEAGDLYFVSGIPFKWESGEHAPFGEAVSGRAFDMHVDVTPKTPSGTYRIGYLAKTGLQTDRSVKYWTVKNDKQELELPLEARGRRIQVHVLSPEPDVPLEIGSMSFFVRPEGRASRKAVV